MEKPSTKNQKTRGSKKRALRGDHAGKEALYLRQDSSEFITKYIEPELRRIYGRTALNRAGAISIERNMEFPSDSPRTTTQLELSVTRNLKEDYPFTVEISIADYQELDDDQVIAQWPLFAKTSLASDLMDTFYIAHTTLEEIDEDTMDALTRQEIMVSEADALDENVEADESFADTLFGDTIYAFARRTLTLRRRTVPRLNFDMGHHYGGETYSLLDTSSSEKEALIGLRSGHMLIGDTPEELMTFADSNRQLRRSVEAEEALDFIHALDKLGFRAR